MYRQYVGCTNTHGKESSMPQRREAAIVGLYEYPLRVNPNSVRHNSCGGGVRRSRYTIDSYATCTDAYPSCKTEGHRHGALPSALAVRGDPPRVQIFSPAGPAL